MKPVAIVILAALLAGLTACSQAAENDARRPAGEAWQGPTDRETATGHDVSEVWDYVALGDSLAAGVGADRGYVDRYATHIAYDTGARARTVNLGVSGQTSSGLLNTLGDPRVRRVLGGAEVVTFNIGINDLGRASETYENGTCGGEDGEECLRAAVEELKENWDAIVAELSDLIREGDAIVRTPGLGYVPRAGEKMRPYVDEVNRHIAATADENGILYAEVRVREGGMSPDGVHPDGTGYATIAERLRELGYGPLDNR